MANKQTAGYAVEDVEHDDSDDSEVEQDDNNWDDWNADDEEGGAESSLDPDMLCLFCDSKFASSAPLFEHCKLIHRFDFHSIRQNLALDFYGSFKLINYIRAQVAENICWSCALICQSKQELQNHLHGLSSLKDIALLWADEKYLKPIMQDDTLLFSFGEDFEVEEDCPVVDNIQDLAELGSISINGSDGVERRSELKSSCATGGNDVMPASDIDMENSYEGVNGDIIDVNEVGCSSNGTSSDHKNLRVSLARAVATEISNVNKNYFGSYSSFGIHREMISDKARTDAYKNAILNNPSLLSGASVMDVGCGTGILSLFAAQAGASRVFAIEASDKMAAVATKVAKDNNLLCYDSPAGETSQATGVIKVVHGMVEELDGFGYIKPHSIDVLLSEWMGYCLLYESMLSSVLLARDRWLKPGGAILPDTATMFVAGFGRGATSIPFWENVYGFNMSCIGKELVEEAAQVPIVDVVASSDIVTETASLQSFDLLEMKADEMDFTSTIELEPRTNSDKEVSWCYGVVLWFETGFSSRFCKEMPVVLSTSPHDPPTHWAQTILTFKEPIAIAVAAGGGNLPPVADKSEAAAAVVVGGGESCPATKMQARISIARAPQHRSIDVSLEITGIDGQGRKRSWPVQIFNVT